MVSFDFDNWAISEEVLSVISIELAIKYRVVPFSLENEALTLIVDEDFDAEKKEVLEFILSKRILTVVIGKDLLTNVIDRYYRKGIVKKDPLTDAIREEEDFSSEKEVMAIIGEGIQKGASDIHWETHSYGKELLIRYRVDGELVNHITTSQHRPSAKIISHIKLLAHMNIDQKRLPQDGRLSWNHYGKKYDLRVSSLPTIHGESLVMRILDREDMNLDMEGLGLLDGDKVKLIELLESSNGLLLVTGPTGSGKTTTLYASLNYRSQFDDKIITVEDPVEYEFSQFSQISVSANVGVTFASALRAMLRQSPDTIMIGEIRDKETAQIAVNAALTGHLVLSTLHSNDALSVVLRLLDLGMEPYQISAVLRGVVAQRLVKKLCEVCKQPYQPKEEELSLLDLNGKNSEEHVFFHPVGCQDCHYTGFKGRLGLFEVLPLDKVFSGLIYDKVSYTVLRNHVDHLSITTLKQCGVEKVLKGLTTIDEVVASIIVG